jgi:hypothetical protein
MTSHFGPFSHVFAGVLPKMRGMCQVKKCTKNSRKLARDHYRVEELPSLPAATFVQKSYWRRRSLRWSRCNDVDMQRLL